MFQRANKLAGDTGLQHDDLLKLPKNDHSIILGPKFDIAWKKHSERYGSNGSNVS